MYAAVRVTLTWLLKTRLSLELLRAALTSDLAAISMVHTFFSFLVLP